MSLAQPAIAALQANLAYRDALQQNDVAARRDQAEADEDAEGQVQPGRAGGIRGQRQPGGIERGADDGHLDGAEMIGDGAGERLRQAPQQVLQGDGEPEHLPADLQVEGDRGEEDAERLADAHRQDEAENTRDHHQLRCACHLRSSRGRNVLIRPPFLPPVAEPPASS